MPEYAQVRPGGFYKRRCRTRELPGNARQVAPHCMAPTPHRRIEFACIDLDDQEEVRGEDTQTEETCSVQSDQVVPPAPTTPRATRARLELPDPGTPSHDRGDQLVSVSEPSCAGAPLPHAFVINLRSRPDRKAAMEAQLADSGLSYEFADAVRKSDKLSKADTLKYVSSIPCALSLSSTPGHAWSHLVTPPQASADAIAEMKEHASVPTLCRRRHTFWARLTPGAIACALSHRQVWEWFRDSPDLGDTVLVLEDDAILCSDFAIHVATITQQLASKASWRFCLLGSHELGQTLLSRRASLASRDLQQGQQTSGLFAYLLHRRALPLLLGPRGPFPLSEQLDMALCDLEWGHLARWTVAVALATSPPSQLGDSDVCRYPAPPPSQPSHPYPHVSAAGSAPWRCRQERPRFASAGCQSATHLPRIVFPSARARTHASSTQATAQRSRTHPPRLREPSCQPAVAREDTGAKQQLQRNGGEGGCDRRQGDWRGGPAAAFGWNRGRILLGQGVLQQQLTSVVRLCDFCIKDRDRRRLRDQRPKARLLPTAGHWRSALHRPPGQRALSRRWRNGVCWAGMRSHRPRFPRTRSSPRSPIATGQRPHGVRAASSCRAAAIRD